jgi:hypothetical protein
MSIAAILLIVLVPILVGALLVAARVVPGLRPERHPRRGTVGRRRPAPNGTPARDV